MARGGYTNRNTSAGAWKAIADLRSQLSAGGEVQVPLAGISAASDTALLQAAINAAADGTTLRLRPGITFTSMGVTVTDKTLHIDARGTTIVQGDHDQPVIKATSGYTNVLSATVSDVDRAMPGTGATTVRVTQATVSDTTGYAIGDTVRLIAADVNPGGQAGTFAGRVGEYAVVGDLDATHIWLTGPTLETYTTTPKIMRVPERRFTLTGGDLDFLDAINDGTTVQALVEINGYKRFLVDRTNIVRAGGYGIHYQGCASGLITGATGNKGTNLETPVKRYSYGLVSSGSENVMHVGCDMSGMRHGYSTTPQAISTSNTTYHRYGRSKYLTYSGCVARGNQGAGFDSHEDGYDIKYVGCTAEGSRVGNNASGAGFAIRARKVKIVASTVRACATGVQGFSPFGPSAGDITIDNTDIECDGAPFTLTGFAGSTLDVTVTGNSKIVSRTSTANSVDSNSKLTINGSSGVKAGDQLSRADIGPTGSGSSTFATTVTTFAAINGGLTLPDFVVPASGAVEVLCNASVVVASATGYNWNVLDSGGNAVAGSEREVGFGVSSGGYVTTTRAKITGLTPGATISGWKWGHARPSGTGTAQAQINTVKSMTILVLAA